MKAKLFITVAGLFQAVLENGTVKDPSSGESQEDFVTRITQEVNEEFMEAIELETVELKGYKKASTTSLKNKAKAAVGLEKEVIDTVLSQRTGHKKEAAQSKANATSQKGGKKPAEKKPKAESKIPKERLDAIEAAKQTPDYKKAKKNIGTAISFKPFKKDAKTVKGTIKNLSLSKDLSRVYYSVEEDKTKRRVCCAVNNESIKIS